MSLRPDGGGTYLRQVEVVARGVQAFPSAKSAAKKPAWKKWKN
jgi:hypothetical protein